MVTQGVQNVFCSTAILFDDFLNGNITSDGSSFFTGLVQLQSQLNNLQGNITLINNTMKNMQSSNTNVSNALSSYTTALTSVAKIPADSVGSTQATLTYNTPLNTASPSTPISSNFPQTLGSNTTGGIIDQLLTSLNASYFNLNLIAQSASTFVSSSSAMNSSLAILNSGIGNLSTQVQSFNDFIFGTFTASSNYQTIVTTTVQIYYGMAIFFAVLMLVGTLMMAFC